MSWFSFCFNPLDSYDEFKGPDAKNEYFGCVTSHGIAEVMKCPAKEFSVVDGASSDKDTNSQPDQSRHKATDGPLSKEARDDQNGRGMTFVNVTEIAQAAFVNSLDSIKRFTSVGFQKMIKMNPIVTLARNEVVKEAPKRLGSCTKGHFSNATSGLCGMNGPSSSGKLIPVKKFAVGVQTPSTHISGEKSSFLEAGYKVEEFNRMSAMVLNSYLLFASSRLHKPIRIAILDTGLHIENDPLLKHGSGRILFPLCRNFTGDSSTELYYKDESGHGTHVVRQLLQHAPEAEIVVIKVAHGNCLDGVEKGQIIKALKYAQEIGADIINLSLGLGMSARPEIEPSIVDLVTKKDKLIFAAASNSGGNGKRAFPARTSGVFAIHATRGDGSRHQKNINPPPDQEGKNFATLGYGIISRWKGQEVVISGTSYATPIAVATAANLLEFIQRAPSNFKSLDKKYFFKPEGMRELLTKISTRTCDYDYIRLWKDGMFDQDNTTDKIYQMLESMSESRS